MRRREGVDECKELRGAVGLKSKYLRRVEKVGQSEDTVYGREREAAAEGYGPGHQDGPGDFAFWWIVIGNGQVTKHVRSMQLPYIYKTLTTI